MAMIDLTFLEECNRLMILVPAHGMSESIVNKKPTATGTAVWIDINKG